MNKFTLLVALAVSTAALMTAPSAQAGRHGQSTVTGPKGKTATHTSSREQGDVESSTTGPNGKTTSRVVNRSPGQTRATVTGPNGQSVTRDSTRSASAPQ